MISVILLLGYALVMARFGVAAVVESDASGSAVAWSLATLSAVAALGLVTIGVSTKITC